MNLDAYLHKNLIIKLTCTEVNIGVNEEKNKEKKDKEVFRILARVKKSHNNAKVCGKSDNT